MPTRTAVERLSAADLPYPAYRRPLSADDLLADLVTRAVNRGTYWGDPRLVASLYWDSQPPAEFIEGLLAELEERGDIERREDGDCCYGSTPTLMLYIQSPERFARFKPRPPMPKSLRRFVLERDGAQCAHCGSPDEPQIDHINPVSRGGSLTDPQNLQVLCRPCNAAKRDMDVDAYLAELIVCDFKGYCKVCC